MCSSYDRHTMSFLVLGDTEEALLLDAGSGVARLYEPRIQEILQQYTRLAVLLTHYHLDHIIGLVPLFEAWENGPVHIFAPEPPLVDGNSKDLPSLIRPPFFGRTFEEYPYAVTISPYGNSQTIQSLDIGWTTIQLRRQQHNGGSAGIRVGDSFAYCTDTACQAETIDFVRGVKLLIHEVWLYGEEAVLKADELSGHTSDEQALQIVKEAQVPNFMPVHHHPSWDTPSLQQKIAGLKIRLGTSNLIWPEEGIDCGNCLMD